MLGELGSLAEHTRDHAHYWDDRPEDHNVFGLFAIGPQEARPWWYEDVRTGDKNRAPATETRNAALQRMDGDKQRRLYRMNLGIGGHFTGRNRRAA